MGIQKEMHCRSWSNKSQLMKWRESSLLVEEVGHIEFEKATKVILNFLLSPLGDTVLDSTTQVYKLGHYLSWSLN